MLRFNNDGTFSLWCIRVPEGGEQIVEHYDADISFKEYNELIESADCLDVTNDFDLTAIVHRVSVTDDLLNCLRELDVYYFASNGTLEEAVGLSQDATREMAQTNDCLLVEEDDLIEFDSNTGNLIIDPSVFDAFVKDHYINIYVAGDDFVGQYKMLEASPEGILMEYIGEADKEFQYFETSDGAMGFLTDVTNEDWYKEPSMTLYDSLEYDCWELICNYAELLGLHLSRKEADFNLAKTIQERVMDLLEAEVGIKFPIYGKEQNKDSLADKIACAAKAKRLDTKEQIEMVQPEGELEER